MKRNERISSVLVVTPELNIVDLFYVEKTHKISINL